MPAVGESERLAVRGKDHLLTLHLRIGRRRGDLLPKLAPSGCDLEAGDGDPCRFAVDQIEKLAVGSPATRRLPRIELELLLWYGVLGGAVKLTATVFGYAQDVSIGRNRTKHRPFDGERPRPSSLHALHVAAWAVSRFETDKDNLLAVRGPAGSRELITLNGTALQWSGIPRAGRQQDNLIIRRREDRERPSAVGRKRLRIAGTQNHGRRTIGRADTDLIGGSGIFTFFAEQNLFAVGRDVGHERPVLPGKIAGLFVIRPHEEDA